MKLFNIALVGAALLFSVQANAQMTTKTQSDKGTSNDMRNDAGEAKLYGEVTMSDVNGKASVKVAFAEVMDRMGSDKNAISVAQDIEGYRFTSLGEALNILSSHGWNVEMVWTTLGRAGEVQHFLISNEIEKISPVSPWLDKGSKGASAKEGAKGGRN
jgi:hypothetical protein